MIGIKMKKYLILTLYFFLFATNAFSATHYVAQTAAGTEDGSSYENRMDVVDHNADTYEFSAGDVIYLVDHIWSRVIIPINGTSENRITYRGDYLGHAGLLTANSSYGTIRGEYKNYITIDNLEIKEGNNGIVFINGCTNITVTNCKIYNMSNKGIMTISDTDPKTRNSDIIIGGSAGNGNEVYNIGTDTGGVDITFGTTDGFIASYNKCYGGEADTGIDGIGASISTDGLIEYNELYDHVDATGPEYGEDGIDLKGSEDIIIQYNHIYGNRANGINVNHHYGTNCSNITIRHNSVHDHKMNIRVANVDNNVYVYSNLVYSSNTSYGIGVTTDGNNVQVYGNTIVNCHGDGTSFQLAFGQGTNYIAKNNIFYSDTHNDLVYVANSSNTVMDNNRYYYTGGAARLSWNGSYMSLAEVQVTGQETNGTEGDPGLTNIGIDDLTLASGSACIDNGEDLGATYDDALCPATTDFSTFSPTVNLLDQDLFGAGWEIGAYVFAMHISDASPAQGNTGVSITTDLNWTNPTGTTNIDLLFDKKSEHDPPTTVELNDQNVETWDCGTLDYSIEYAWRIDVNHAGGTETGVVYYFTTTAQANPPTPAGAIIRYQESGVEGLYHKLGIKIGK